MLKKRVNATLRNLVLVITVAFAVSLISTAYSYAKEKQLVIFGLGGKVQEIVTKYAKESGIDVLYRTLPHYTSATALQSQPEIGTIDLFIAHDVLISQIGRLGILEELDLESLKERHHLYSYAELEDKYGVAIGTIATGIAYLPTIFDKRNLAAPHSWRDLYEPPDKLKEHIAIPDISTIYGWQNLAVATILVEKKELVEGLKEIEQLKPFYLTDNPDEVANLFKQKKVWISPWASDTVLRLIEEEKLPLEFIYPDEGVPLSKIAVSKARGTTRSDLANEFIHLLLSKEFQERAVKYLYWGPVNSEINLTGRAAEVLPHGEFRQIPVDWSYIDTYKFKLTEEWSELFY